MRTLPGSCLPIAHNAHTPPTSKLSTTDPNRHCRPACPRTQSLPLSLTRLELPGVALVEPEQLQALGRLTALTALEVRGGVRGRGRGGAVS